jgi:stage V sporulation protein B
MEKNMEKVLSMGQVSASGSMRLFLGKISSYFSLAVGTIFLTMLISEADYGLYTLATVPVSIVLLFQDWGVGAAMTKYCAKWRIEKQEHKIRKAIVSGLVFEASTGLLLALFLFTISNLIALSIFNKPESAFLLSIISISVFFSSLLLACQSIFIGFERMGLNSILMICQALTQGILSPLLVFLGYGAIGATVGFTVASMVVGIFAIVLLYFSILRKLDSHKSKGLNMYEMLKPLIRFGVPYALANLMIGLLSQFYWLVIGSVADVVTIGNFRVAYNFGVLLTFITLPISTVLFPAFSKLNPESDGQHLKIIFKSSVKYTSLLLVPFTIGLMVLSEPLVGTIYDGKWPLASLFLSLMIIGNLSAVFGAISNNGLLAGMGETRMLMKLNGLALLIAIPLSLVFIPIFGVLGAIFVAIVSAIPSWTVGLHWTWKRYGVRANLRSSAGIVCSSSVAACLTFIIISVLSAADWVRLIAGLAIFSTTYLLATPLVGGISFADINNLRAMFGGLGTVSRLLNVPLKLMELPLRIRTSQIKAIEIDE